MNTLNLTASQVNPSLTSQQFNQAYEYYLQVIDRHGDLQKLTASFTSLPSPADWSDWLWGWSSTGYFLFSQPQLIRTI